MPNYPLSIVDCQLDIVPHTLRFKRPARTSRGEYLERKVWYLRLTSSSDPSIEGWGECAPLPDLSCDALPDAEYEALLQQVVERAKKNGTIDTEALRNYPSILFGLETVLLSAQASRCGELTKLFDTPFARGEHGIPINGLVWMGDKDYMAEQMEEKLRQGFKCVKLKIGALDFSEELHLLESLRRRFSPSKITLRLDANGAYSPERALEILHILAPLGIHSIEQPIRAGQWEEMRKICEVSPIPVALDEELIGINQKEEKIRLLETIRPQYLVLKPSLHGGIAGTEEWIALAEERGIGFWLTSALESNVGLNAIAQLAGRIDSPYMLKTQGLGTGALFEKNFEGTQLCIEGDELRVKSKKERDFEQEVADFISEFQNSAPTIRVKTSGSTGTPKTITVEKSRMRASARATCDFLGISARESVNCQLSIVNYPLSIKKALLCLPIEYIAGKMMVVRALEHNLSLIIRHPSGHPLRHICTPIDFAAFTPMQVYNMLRDPEEREKLSRISQVIIGGGSIPEEMAKELRTFPNAIWSTYGMTETLSHIALRRLSGADASKSYQALPNAKVSLNKEKRIVISAPSVCSETLITNDIGEIFSDGAFRILGRTDNTICSGGIKVQPEIIEELLAQHDIEAIITSIPDPKFGEAIVLLHTNKRSAEELKLLCTNILEPYQIPRHFCFTEHLPLTENGKISRSEAKELAKSMTNS